MLYAIYDREAKLEALEQAKKLTANERTTDIFDSPGDAKKGANLFKVSHAAFAVLFLPRILT